MTSLGRQTYTRLWRCQLQIYWTALFSIYLNVAFLLWMSLLEELRTGILCCRYWKMIIGLYCVMFWQYFWQFTKSILTFRTFYLGKSCVRFGRQLRRSFLFTTFRNIISLHTYARRGLQWSENVLIKHQKTAVWLLHTIHVIMLARKV